MRYDAAEKRFGANVTAVVGFRSRDYPRDRTKFIGRHGALRHGMCS
jgi:hypothetical protein